MQTALVAGGAGFIGSYLCRFLTESFFVICVDNLSTGQKENIEDLLSHKNFEFLEKDVAKPLQLSRKIDFIFHLASPASPSKDNPKSYINHPVETLLANSQGSFNLLELAKKNSARFLYASSSEVYGDPLVSPQSEEYYGNVNPIGVRSVYDESKRFGEALTMVYARKKNLDVRIARIFNTYGPKMPDDGRVVINFIRQALKNEPITVYGKGEQTRSFCYVDDLVNGLIKMILLDEVKGEVINLGNPEELKIIDLANKIAEMANSSSEIVFSNIPEDDPKKRKPDISKAKRLLSWEPKVKLEEGLKKTIEYLKSP